MTSRRDQLLSIFDPNGHGLEIGPGYNPLMPKSAGYEVETADYIDRDGLIKKYKNDPHVDTGRIEEVDYVTGGRTLLESIPYRDHYDYVIASHVIEHTPDLLDLLIGCAELLTADGVLVLAVPDKRFCFDMLLPESTTGGILQAHLEGRRRPQPGAVFDSVAYGALRDGLITWSADNASPPTFQASLQTGKEHFDLAARKDEYIDVHVWRFVPSSFRLIVEDLHALGVSPLREHRFIAGPEHEFFVALTRQGKGPELSREQLAVGALRELAAVRLPEA